MSLLVVSNTLDAEDLVVLLLGLDQLERYANKELAKDPTNSPKQVAVIHMRSQILLVRAKLRRMREAL